MPAIRCPRCKRTITGDDDDVVVEMMQQHALSEHGGHLPPREHILARLHRRNAGDVGRRTGDSPGR